VAVAQIQLLAAALKNVVLPIVVALIVVALVKAKSAALSVVALVKVKSAVLSVVVLVKIVVLKRRQRMWVMTTNLMTSLMIATLRPSY